MGLETVAVSQHYCHMSLSSVHCTRYTNINIARTIDNSSMPVAEAKPGYRERTPLMTTDSDMTRNTSYRPYTIHGD